jgi:hypothetical protein
VYIREFRKGNFGVGVESGRKREIRVKSCRRRSEISQLGCRVVVNGNNITGPNASYSTRSLLRDF